MIKKCLIAIAILLFSTGVIVLDGNKIHRFILSASSSWAYDQGEIREGNVVLKKKEENCIFIYDRCYQFTEATVIRDSSGEIISPFELSLPCFAKVIYYQSPKEDFFEVRSIKVLDNSP